VDETLAAARRGDREALQCLLRTLQDPWYRLCLSLLGDAERARDATQETALRFLRQLPGFRGESQLRTWSLGIAVNVVREIRRSSRAGVPLAADFSEAAETASQPSPVQSAELSERRDRVRAVLDRLPERQRETVVLRFFEDLSTEETAIIMDCATGTVKATLHQALRSLREKLKELV
jgi:RNA polymerase sigma-70 factor (ECF subfamily)